MFIVRNFPLLVLPLIIYNLFGWGVIEATGSIWPNEVARFQMISGQSFVLTLGGVLIIVALLLLFVEILKATRTAQATIVDHLLSTIIFIVYLLQFVVDPTAATMTFLILTVIAFLDVIAGYSISIRVASRDVTLDPRI